MLVTSAQYNEFKGQDTGCVTAIIDGVEMSVPKVQTNRQTTSRYPRMGS